MISGNSDLICKMPISLPWSGACPDWEARLLAGRPPIPDLPPLWRARAAKPLRMLKRLRLPDVIGKPSFGEVAAEWFFEVATAIFGSYDPKTQRRDIQELFLLIPKKNSKSSGAAGLILTAALVTERPSAEFVLLAPTKEIADISFGQAEGMIKADQTLTKVFHLQPHLRRITDRRTDAVIEVKAADTETITGGKQAVTLIDETHEFSRKPRSADVFTEVRGALASRTDGFLLQISTQSKVPPSGVFRAELNTARAVRDGRLNLPRLLPVLYELPERVSKDWRNRKYWPIINPNLGRSVDEIFLEDGLVKAEQEGPGALALFASQHFNVEIGVALQSDRWVGADYWEAQTERGLTLNDILGRAEVVEIGIDGGGLDDLLGFGVLGRDRNTKQWMFWSHAWAHIGVLERRKSEAQKLRDLETAGDLTIVERLGDDVAEVAELCERIDRTGKLAHVGLDPSGVGLIVDALEGKRIRDDRVVGIPQGWKMTNAIKTSERKLADGSFVHCGQALMAWAVGNAKVEPKGNAVVITKQAAGTAKIDPLMAMFDCVALMSMNPEAQGSVYDNASDYEAAFGRKPNGNGDDGAWHPDVLADVHHPLFAEHKRRFEAWQARQPENEEQHWGSTL